MQNLPRSVCNCGKPESNANNSTGGKKILTQRKITQQVLKSDSKT